MSPEGSAFFFVTMLFVVAGLSVSLGMPGFVIGTTIMIALMILKDMDA